MNTGEHSRDMEGLEIAGGLFVDSLLFLASVTGCDVLRNVLQASRPPIAAVDPLVRPRNAEMAGQNAIVRFLKHKFFQSARNDQK
ncbi:hypothetical protein BV898_09916 [Hypsibius exemplaris]|uniref:Uncharacterized protein n=1 Tax=Hypsibius exemplaris TaxID=2072580 RepID=A0A1W0WLB9_HYPEX|nr:hypothetical protein BV898_09916 [Hypsibius exemplaris]